jgi:hypothetical protein
MVMVLVERPCGKEERESMSAGTHQKKWVCHTPLELASGQRPARHLRASRRRSPAAGAGGVHKHPVVHGNRSSATPEIVVCTNLVRNV